MFELLNKDFNRKIIGYDNMCKITKNIFQGNKKSREYVDIFNIKKVIQIGTNEEIRNYKSLPNNIDYITIVINKENKLIKSYDKIWDFIEYNYNKNILIQCNDGSISILFLISYLIAYKFYTYETALELIIKKKENKMDFTLFKHEYVEEIHQLDNELKHFRNLIHI